MIKKIFLRFNFYSATAIWIMLSALSVLTKTSPVSARTEAIISIIIVVLSAAATFMQNKIKEKVRNEQF